MMLRAYEFVLSGQICQPSKNEEFYVNWDTGFLEVFDPTLPPQEGYTKFLVEIINLQHIQSICFLPQEEPALCICEDMPNPECKAHPFPVQ